MQECRSSQDLLSDETFSSSEKSEKPFLAIKFEIYRDKWKTNTGKVIQKALYFQPSYSFEKNPPSEGAGLNSAANGIGKKEPPSIHRRGLNQNVN